MIFTNVTIIVDFKKGQELTVVKFFYLISSDKFLDMSAY